MRMALIEGGAVTNVIEADEGFEIEGKTLVASEAAGIGWTWDGQTLSPPVPTRDGWRETAQLSRRDFVLALAAAEILPPAEAIAAAKGDWPATFNAFLTGLSDADQLALQIEWAAATMINRAHPMIDALAAVAGLTPEQVDDLFGWSGS